MFKEYREDFEVGKEFDKVKDIPFYFLTINDDIDVKYLAKKFGKYQKKDIIGLISYEGKYTFVLDNLNSANKMFKKIGKKIDCSLLFEQNLKKDYFANYTHYRFFMNGFVSYIMRNCKDIIDEFFDDEEYEVF